MKIKIEIKSWYSGSVLFEYESDNNTIRETLQKAIETRAYLRNADLRGADLTGADLRTEERRPDGRRPDGRRPEERRPDGRRPEERRPDGRRPEERRPDADQKRLVHSPPSWNQRNQSA